MVTLAEKLPEDELLARVRDLPDPELRMVTLGDLGLVRGVRIGPDGVPEVDLSPLFVGCPAMTVIEEDVRAVLAECGYREGRVRKVLSPAWSSDWIAPEGRAKLAAHGIAPPCPTSAPESVRDGFGAACPHCGGTATRPFSTFGPTRCQVILECAECQEIFPRMRVI